ncbi:MAG: IS701 family transposase [bacterium]|nr:MAG: IS701 family transposase [bacterium]
MEYPLIIRGRRIDESDVEFVRLLLAKHSDKSRSYVSRLLSEYWQWYQQNGRLKDRTCRDILTILAQKNLIELPPLRKKSCYKKKYYNKIRQLSIFDDIDCSSIEGPLQLFLPLSFKVVCQTSLELLWNRIIKRFHYLGYKALVGTYLKYLVYSNQGQLLAAIGWGSSVWKLKPRDMAIGWNCEQRSKHLHRLANNQRFLILPWVNIKNLASYILAQNIQMLNFDWQERYGYHLYLLETFVDPTRFSGTCYKAANWIYVGQTKGYRKQGNTFEYHGNKKEVFLYPLNPRFRKLLGCDNSLLPALDHQYYLSLKTTQEPKKRGRSMIFNIGNWGHLSQPPFDLNEEDIQCLDEMFQDFHSIFSEAYRRIEQEELSAYYLYGLMSPIERKSMEPIAIHLLDTKRVRSMQHFVSSGIWDTEILAQTHKEESSKTLSAPDGVFSLDASEFVKKGKDSVGVARQWCGRLGKTENCQSGVFLGYASSKGYGLIDRNLYLPEIWFSDDYKERYEKCKIPDDIEFQTKNEIALNLLQETHNSGLFPAKWVTCDSFFGRDSNFLDRIPKDLYYFAEIPCNIKVWTQWPQCEIPKYTGKGRKPQKEKCTPQPTKVLELAKDPNLKWEKRILAQGAKGPIMAEVTRLRIIVPKDNLPYKECWLFIRKDLGSNKTKYFVSNAPENISFDEMCRVCTMRWPIEQCFQEGKSYLGMSHYEHRSWEAWHRHMTFVFIAQLFLTRIRIKYKKNSCVNFGTSNLVNEGGYPYSTL